MKSKKTDVLKSQRFLDATHRFELLQSVLHVFRRLVSQF